MRGAWAPACASWPALWCQHRAACCRLSCWSSVCPCCALGSGATPAAPALMSPLHAAGLQASDCAAHGHILSCPCMRPQSIHWSNPGSSPRQSGIPPPLGPLTASVSTMQPKTAKALVWLVHWKGKQASLCDPGRIIPGVVRLAHLGRPLRLTCWVGGQRQNMCQPC